MVSRGRGEWLFEVVWWVVSDSQRVMELWNRGLWGKRADK